MFSKGTYIRSLVETLAEKMDTLAHVAALRRTRVAGFEGQSMVTLEALESLEGDPRLPWTAFCWAATSRLQGYPDVQLSADEAFYLLQRACRRAFFCRDLEGEVSGFTALKIASFWVLGRSTRMAASHPNDCLSLRSEGRNNRAKNALN